MTKLRERIGALTLRSVLLLAALLALSQTASATLYMAGNWSGGSNWSNLPFTETSDNTYTCTVQAEDASKLTFKLYDSEGTDNSHKYVSWDRLSSTTGIKQSGSNYVLDTNTSTLTGTVTFTVSVTSSFGTAANDREYSLAAVFTPESQNSQLYLEGNWADGWDEKGWKPFSKNTDGTYSCTLLNTNGSTLRFKIVKKATGNNEVYGADATSINPKTGVENANVADNESYNNFKLIDAANKNGTVKITVTLDDNGRPTSLVATFVADGGQLLPTDGMPFYPRGVYGEESFNLLPDGEKYYYLIGHAINANFASPEWQMISTDGGQTYTIDFTYNDHKEVSGYPYACGDSDHKYQFSVVYYTKDSSTATSAKTVENIGKTLATFGEGDNKMDYAHAGVRMRATYKPGDGSLTFDFLDANGNITTSASEAQYLPFISLVGEMASAETDVKTIGNDTSKTSGDWQQAWIQYNDRNQAMKSRDGKYVYYNTQWPPLETIFFTVPFTSGGETYNMGLDSNGLTFKPVGTRGSGAEIKKMYSDLANLDLEDEEDYIVYRAEDFWASGKFKIWSGWNGGLKNGGGAEWEQNWNWGHANQQAGTEVPVQVAAGQTYKLGNKNGDMKFENPTYLSDVYFFLNVKHPNITLDNEDDLQYTSRFYTVESYGATRIQAMNHKQLTAGLFAPSVSKDFPDLIQGVRVRVYRSNNPDIVVSTVLSEGNIEGSAQSLDWTCAQFADKMAALEEVTAAGEGYPAGFLNDGVNYPNSGAYFYTMEVKFSGKDEVVVVKSNPFNIVKTEAALVAAQLVKVNKEKAAAPYNGYDYITYSVGSDIVYGVTATEVDAEGTPVVTGVTELAAITDPKTSYSDREKCTWTHYVLLYARRPWAGDNPTMPDLIEPVATNWAVSYPLSEEENGLRKEIADVYGGADNSNRYLAYIVPAPGVLRANTYKATITYTCKDGSGNTLTPEPAEIEQRIVLRIPTPRMLSNPMIEATVVRDDTQQSVDVSSADHIGFVTEENYSAESNCNYANARVRRLSFTAELDMPNATEELIALIPGDNDGHYYRQTRFSGGDAKLLELLDNEDIRLDLRSTQPTTVTFADQNLSNWITVDPADGTVTPIARNLKFDFERNGRLLTFFDRTLEGVTFSLSPEFGAPSFKADSKASLYRYKYPVEGADNLWKERIVLVNIPEIEPDQTTSLTSTHKVEVLADRAYYALKFDDEVVGLSGKDGDSATNALLAVKGITDDENVTITLAESTPFTWYAEMDEMRHVSFNSMDVSVAHGYIFYTDRHAEFAGALSAGHAPALAEAPAKAAAQTGRYIAYVGPFSAPYTITDKEIATSVEAIGSYDAPAGVAGNGFIDMLSQGNVYTVDGRCVFSGTGRVDVQPGIYVIATPKAAYKVIVK